MVKRKLLIGRCYILNFHRLFTDFNSQRGPNVLALSGTSYLPNSTQFHVGTQNDKPYGVLMPEQTAKNAIAESHFEFLPQFDNNEKLIRISGSPEKQKPTLFKEITRSLLGNNGRGRLGQKLEELGQLGKQNPERWQDRDRLLLLVNSYEQSRWAAQEIRRCWLSMSQYIRYLVPDSEHDSFDVEGYFEPENGALRRTDIETFGQTDSKISDGSYICLSPSTLVSFVEKTLTTYLTSPTLIIIEADNWRMSNRGGWTQLQNPKLSQALNHLEFGSNRFNNLRTYQRDDPQLNHLLGIIRIRTGDETPQYITNRETWQQDDANLTRDLYSLSGFVDCSSELFHYFSIGRLPDMVKGYQAKKLTEDPYKLEDGGGIPFKHQQMVEMVPFFVQPELQTDVGLRALCRVPHSLRSSPAWTMGNLVYPYPMHLGQQLIDDQLCILGIDT